MNEAVKIKTMAWYGPNMGMKLEDIAEAAEEDDAIADDLLVKEGEYPTLQDAFESWGIDENDSVKMIEAAWWDEAIEQWHWYTEKDCREVIALIEVIHD